MGMLPADMYAIARQQHCSLPACHLSEYVFMQSSYKASYFNFLFVFILLRLEIASVRVFFKDVCVFFSFLN